MFTQRAVPQYPSQVSFQPANMLTRNTIPFPPGFPLYTTKNGTMTPVYPPGLYIDPDVVRRQVAPRFIADFPLMSNMDQEHMPQYLPRIALNSNTHNQPHSSISQYFNSNIGAIIKCAPGLKPPPGVFMVQPSQNTNFDLPITADFLQQTWSTQAQASESLVRQLYGLPLSYEILGEATIKPEDCRNFATRRSQGPPSNKNQQQTATCLQAFSNSEPYQQAYPFTDNTRREEEEGGGGERLEKAQVLVNGERWDLETEFLSEDKPPQLDEWGLPNTDLKYYNEGVPDNPHMLDLEYVEENPRCILLISPEEALTFGTWSDWKLNNRVRRWMIEQDLEGITNSVEKVSKLSYNSVSSAASENDNVSLEDTIQSWESVSSTEEKANFYQKLLEKSKFGIVTQVIEYLDGEDDWLPGETSPEMARVMEEGW